MTSSARPPEPGSIVVPSVPRSVAAVRRFAVEQCAGVSADACDTVALLVSEVATNALVHGRGDVEVKVFRLRDVVRVEVADSSPDLPRQRAADADAEGGRGLALVDALAVAWGTHQRAGGKTVWFEVRP